MEYIIAASHPKMMRRFATRDSKENLYSFMSMKPGEIRFKATCFQTERLNIELLNDHLFLNALPSLVPDYATKYPNIASLNDSRHPALAALNSQFELFNTATYEEYHLLFQHLLTQYQRDVGQVASLAKDFKPFNDEAASAAEIGHGLLTMVKGRAFHLYLSTTARILKKHISRFREAVSDEIDADEIDADEPDSNLEDDAVTDSWQPFKTWILLMLVPLDAADSLCSFVKKVGLGVVEIDVKLVYSPIVSRETIPLEKLLQVGHIPEPGIRFSPITNTELLAFVKASNVRKKQIQTVQFYNGLKLDKWDAGHILEAKKFIQGVLNQAKEEDEAAGIATEDKAAKKQKSAKKHKTTKHHKATRKHKAAEDNEKDSNQGNRGVGLNATISALCNEIIVLLSRQPRNFEPVVTKFGVLLTVLLPLQRLPFTESSQANASLHCEAGLASILDKTTRDAIQTRIDQLEVADLTQKDEKLYHTLLDLLKETEVGFFFSVRLVPMANTCSFHDGRSSGESSGYQNAAVLCAVYFFLFYHWMEQPAAPPALSPQVFTAPFRTAPYRNGPRKST